MVKIRRGVNRKIKNAKKSSYNDIKFRSDLELYCYKKLKENNLKFGYENVKYILVPSFKINIDFYDKYSKDGELMINSQSIREMTYTPDFVSDDGKYVIECKGFPSDTFPLKWKLFKNHIIKNENKIEKVFLPRSKKQIDQTINIIIKQYDI